jgi:hypothetical protein
MTRQKLDDDQLVSMIEQMERQAIGYYNSQVAGEQAKAMDYYLGKPLGTEEEGRSQVISSDVWDVVEGMTPMVLKPFVATDDVVRFNPLGPDDEDAAQQETDYINWVVTQKNDVFNELVAWVKNGLLQKNGVVKYWWEKSRRASIERYFGVPDDVFALLAGEDGVEVVEHTENPGEPEQHQDPQTGAVVMIPGPPTHDVTLRVIDEVGEARYCVVAPEELLVGRDSRSPNLQACRFVEHRAKRTLSELRELGYDVDDDLAGESTDDVYMSLQYQARHSAEESNWYRSEVNDPSLREVTFREVYMLVDADGDGIAELRKICIVGRTILANEETEEVPFCAWTPYMQPHKFYGRCPADETAEIQLVKSTLWRQSLDNIYTINNNRTYANENVNLDDLIDNQIGGVIRVKGGEAVGNAVAAAQVQPIGGVIQPMIEYLDSAKENRTGFTRYNQGSDGEGLNKTATGIRLIKESANGRIEIISRAFAEQGLAPLMRGIHGLCRRHATKAETIQLRGKWVQVDPRAWKKRTDMTVSVGLGTSDQQMRMQGVQMLRQTQGDILKASAGGALPPIVSPQNVFNAAAKLTEALGYKNPEQFFTSPDQIEPPKPPPAPDPTQDPAFQIKQRELDQKDREIDIKAADTEFNHLKQKAEFEHGIHKHETESQRAAATEGAEREESNGLAALQAQVQQIGQMLAQLLQAVQPQGGSPAHESAEPPAMEAVVQEDTNGQA